MTWLTRLFSKLGFGKQRASDRLTEARISAAVKRIRLGDISRKRGELQMELIKAKREKKARRWIYEALEALKQEEIKLAGDLP